MQTAERPADGATADFPQAPPAENTQPSLERFGATLAHELRGPLAAICNGLYILRHSPKSSADGEWALTMMERQASYMRALIDDVMEVGRLASSGVSIQRERVDLHHIVSDAIESAAATLESSNRDIAVDSEGAPFVVRGDPRRLRQAFVNLLTNSIKFSAPGGRIRVRLVRNQDFAVVEVADDGSGIAAEQLPHVFELYAQGEQQRKQRTGLGVGLAIVQAVVRLHGGSVRADSAGPGQGARFIVELPLEARLD